MTNHSRNRTCIFLLASVLAVLFFARDVSAATFLERTLAALQGGGAQVVAAPDKAEVAFSPSGGATDLVIKTIGSAKQSIKVAAYSFTSRPIATALLNAKKNGINIAVVVDHGQIDKNSHSVTASLALAGIDVRVDTKHAIQHDKYMIIDGKTVETGSFNYTAAAEQHNSENVLVLWNAPQLASVYNDNWQALWDMAEPYAGK